MSRIIFIILFFPTLLFLTNCSSLSSNNEGILYNRDTEYLKAQAGTPLAIPAGIHASSIEEHYPVTEERYPNEKRKIDLLPPELSQAAPAPVAPQTTDEIIHQQPALPNYYFDRNTRTAGRNTESIGAIWPWGKKESAASTSQEPSNEKRTTSADRETKTENEKIHKGQNGYIMPNYYYDRHANR